MGLLGLDMGKVTLVRKKSVGSSFFLKLVRPLVFRDPGSAENRVRCFQLKDHRLEKLLSRSVSRSLTN